MATNIPPHNLGEVVDATIMLIDNPDATIEELMTVIKGPDFPTGAFIFGREGIKRAYATGRGTIKVRAKASIEEEKGKERIVITEIPYLVNKAKLIEDIANLVRAKRIEGISDLRDESDREGMRIVIELKGSANAEIILNQLYKHTQMESTFGVINLALVDGEPKVLNLKETLFEYIRHRKAVVTRRTAFELDKAERRKHILEGLRIALDNIDAIIKIIKGSKTVDQARESLISNFNFSKVQAQAILDMRLQKLTGLEREKIDQEYEELLKRIAWLKEVLASEERVLDIIKEELQELKEKYSDERRTEIVEGALEIEDEDLIPVEDMVITITSTGYIKRLPVDTYRKQRRGGKGIIGMETKEGDFVKDLFIASTHDYMLFFTNKGKIYWKKVYEIPSAGRYARGKAIVNLLDIEEDENVTAMIPISKFDEEHYLVFATKKGTVKKTVLSAYSRPRRTGIRAITLGDGDELVDVRLTDGEQEIVLGTKYGKAIRFSEREVRAMGRTARGVIGIRLRENDAVIAMEIVREGSTLLTITENGYGKRTSLEEYRITRRGGKGIINIKTSKRNGLAIGIKEVLDGDELIITSSEGIIIRMPVRDISVIGRNTQGVRIMRLHENDRVVAVERVVLEDEGE
jgi:DNA gyrase subunit A